MDIKKLRALQFVAEEKLGPEWNSWQEFRIREEDEPHTLNALSWVCVDEFFPVPTKEKGVLRFRGSFSMQFDRDIISDLVQVYLELGKHFLKLQEIFTTNKFATATAIYLLQAQKDVLAALTSTEPDMEQQRLKEIQPPAWLLKTAELLEGEYNGTRV